PNAIQLDIVYVERPIDDARLGDELWRYTDQIAAIDQKHRETMRRNGFRVGVVGSNPPLALQQMLGLKSDFVYEPDAEKAKGLVGHRSVIQSGGQTEIQTSPIYRECSIELPGSGESGRRSYTNVVCKYHITAERLQDGWVQLDFVPQIHYGDEQLRRDVGDDGWRLSNKQRTATFFPQRFQVKLSVGEMALVTADDDAEGRLGELFFRGPQALAPNNDVLPGETHTASSPTVQRILVVRLAGMSGGGAPHSPSQ
ncbi:MAG TPA: hypothetical protein VL475_02325, partial [Planctomycetaceae bacterium]|nr:hypothetical protein [Planctomycetaceae bacterium]